jgi:hypothetical protein
VLHRWSDGKGGQKIEDTGPLTRARMPTADQEFFAAATAFIDRAHQAGTTFFCRPVGARLACDHQPAGGPV